MDLKRRNYCLFIHNAWMEKHKIQRTKANCIFSYVSCSIALTILDLKMSSRPDKWLYWLGTLRRWTISKSVRTPGPWHSPAYIRLHFCWTCTNMGTWLNAEDKKEQALLWRIQSFGYFLHPPVGYLNLLAPLKLHSAKWIKEHLNHKLELMIMMQWAKNKFQHSKLDTLFHGKTKQ